MSSRPRPPRRARARGAERDRAARRRARRAGRTARSRPRRSTLTTAWSRSTRSWWETADCSIPTSAMISDTDRGPSRRAAEDLQPAGRRQREHRVGEPLGGVSRERGRALGGARIGRGHRGGHRGGRIEPSTAVSYVRAVHMSVRSPSVPPPTEPRAPRRRWFGDAGEARARVPGGVACERAARRRCSSSSRFIPWCRTSR